MAQTTFGQSHALALAVVAWLNSVSASLCTSVAAEVRFARVTDLSQIPTYDQPASIDVFPDTELRERTKSGSGASLATFTSHYAIHVFIQQRTDGTDEEALCGLLSQLRSEVINLIPAAGLSLPNAVHPLAANQLVFMEAKSVDRGPDGRGALYDIARLEEAHVFESDTIVIFKAAA